jgi:hypothetical protein
MRVRGPNSGLYIRLGGLQYVEVCVSDLEDRKEV